MSIPGPVTGSGSTCAATLRSCRVEFAISIPGSLSRVFSAFIEELPQWWQADGNPSGGSCSMRFDAQPGGLLTEHWDGRDGILWAQFAAIESDRLVRLAIPEGAAWSGPGSVTFRFSAAADDSTLIELTHVSTGDYTDDYHEGFLAGWRKQLDTGFMTYFNASRSIK